MNLPLLSFLFFLSAAASIVLLILLRRAHKNLRAVSNQMKEKVEFSKEAVQQTAQEKERTFAILEGMTEGVAVVDKKQKIILVNSSLVEAFGFQKERVTGLPYWEVFRDPEINQMLEKSLGSRVVTKREQEVLLSRRVFQIQVSPVFNQDEFLGVVCVFYDVTKIKELEKIRSEFVANVSHELRTPMTSILGFVETLKEGAVEDASRRDHFLTIVQEQSQRLLTLIEDLLLLSKIESSQQALDFEEVDIEKTIDKILKSFKLPIASKKLKVVAVVTPKTFSFKTNCKMFQQLVFNLIDNAIKYNEPNGEVEISALLEGDKLQLKVRDTGVGIPQEVLPRIFERFYRVDKSRSRDLGGTGLGLSIAKHIADQLHGTLDVESDAGKGTTFTALLPPL